MLRDVGQLYPIEAYPNDVEAVEDRLLLLASQTRSKHAQIHAHTTHAVEHCLGRPGGPNERDTPSHDPDLRQ